MTFVASQHFRQTRNFSLPALRATRIMEQFAPPRGELPTAFEEDMPTNEDWFVNAARKLTPFRRLNFDPPRNG